MRIGGRPATSTHTGAGEPVEVYGAGVLVAAGLLRESTRVCVLAEAPPDRRREAKVVSWRKEGRHGGHVRPGCRFGCRQGVGDGVRTHTGSAWRPGAARRAPS